MQSAVRIGVDESVQHVVVPHLAHGVAGVERDEVRPLERHHAQPLRAQRLADRRALRLVADVVQRDHVREALAGLANFLGNTIKLARRAPHEAQDAVALRTGGNVLPRATPPEARRAADPRGCNLPGEQGRPQLHGP